MGGEAYPLLPFHFQCKELVVVLDLAVAGHTFRVEERLAARSDVEAVAVSAAVVPVAVASQTGLLCDFDWNH